MQPFQIVEIFERQRNKFHCSLFEKKYASILEKKSHHPFVKLAKFFCLSLFKLFHKFSEFSKVTWFSEILLILSLKVTLNLGRKLPER